MKLLLSTLCLFFILLSANAQSANSGYDQALADSLGADEYGMKSYVLVILKTGTNKTTDQEKTNQLFRGHMENIGKLAAEGKLIVAGPLSKNEKDYRGIFILNVSSLDEAESLLQTDPAVKARLLDAELYKWYGSAALPLYLPAHSKIEKKKP